MDNNFDPLKNANLVLKYLRGELDATEKEAFEHWIRQSKSNQEFLQVVKNEEKLKQELDLYASIDPEKNWQRFIGNAKPEPKVIQLWHRFPIVKYAAVFLLLALSALTLFLVTKKQPEVALSSQNARPGIAEIKPVKDKAKLILADGTEILLDETNNGLLSANPHVKITKENETIVYQFLGKPAADQPLEYHTISTPKGGQFQLVLPDGTKVWLNAASSLRFPVAFVKGERNVTLRGEGYFEVAKIKEQPFKVSANNTSVVVLGTHFNIKAYANENGTKTTLLEGSVKVNSSNQEILLKPGLQAITGNTNEIITAVADLEQVMAWKEGYFQFDNEDFNSIAAQLERWYNVEFVYLTTISSRKFAGAIPRNTSLNEVLQMLELSGSIKTKIEGRRILVQPEE